MSEPEIVVTKDAAELASIAARRFVQVVREGQASGRNARVALSGGSTPRALFTLLASDEFKDRVEWKAIDVFWGDERTVPPDHADSNYRMANETLLNLVPIPESNVHRMHCEIEPDEAARLYEAELAAVFGNATATHPPQFDLILLGIGGDGHTASLFPGTDALSVRDRLVVANPVPQQQTTRLSLTVPVLLAAREVLFLVAGADKAPAVYRAIEGPWNPDQTPSQYLRQATGHVVWLLDKAAAADLGNDTAG